MISVIIPMYNRENTIEYCLKAVMNQTYRDLEIIIVDDGSNDNSVNLVKKISCSDNRVKIFELGENHGVSYARNFGIDKAEGEFVAFQDSDDEWVLDKLEKQLSVLQEKNVDMVFSAFITYYMDSMLKQPNDRYSDGFITYDDLLDGNIISPTTLLIRSDIIKQFKYDDELNMYEDWKQVLDMLKCGYKVYYLSDIVNKVYRQENSLSNNMKDVYDSAVKLMDNYSNDFYTLKKIFFVITREFTYLKQNELRSKFINRYNEKYFRKTIVDNKLVSEKFEYDATILVQSYNRIEKTKQCIENIMKYTKNVNYCIFLLDDGSTDETPQYFKELEKKYDNVKAICSKNNKGSNISQMYVEFMDISKYFVLVNNDIIVTKNWLSNLIKCAESDESIGMVNPMSSNVSNYQQYNIEFYDLEDMQKKAEAFNKSDPTKWYERLRLITIGALFKKECLLAVGWPIFDCAFMHDFSDDDISFRVRRAGYKCILAGDTWLHHNHDFMNFEDKDPMDYDVSLEIGRQYFKNKYFGIDAWYDTGNFMFQGMSNHVLMPNDMDNVSILGIDVKCGTPILEIKNIIREYGIFNAETNSFFKDSKYHIDNKTICNGKVICDRSEYILDSFEKESFDYIVIGEPINSYKDYEHFIKNVHSLLKPNGQLFFDLKNTYNVFSLIKLLGHNLEYDEKLYHIQMDDFYNNLKHLGYKIQLICDDILNNNENLLEFSKVLLDMAKPKDASTEKLLKKLFVSKLRFKITK